MRVMEQVAERQAQSQDWRRAGQTVALVPTMGALHAGHISLVRAAQEANDRVIVSVFVNPTQFNQKSDLDAYPRDFDTDARMLAEAGVDVVFHPSIEEMYPTGLRATRVRPGPVADLYEGEHRPAHFEGVATVVARLFHAGLPDRAYFGRKDAQQLAVIRAMVRDLGFPIEVVGCATTREVDGLAMSSRNARLSPQARQSAVALVRALAEAQRAFGRGTRDPARIAEVAISLLQAALGIELEYAAVVDPLTFRPPQHAAASSLVLLAARTGSVRLIDNAELGAADVLEFAAAPAASLSSPTRSQGVPA